MVESCSATLRGQQQLFLWHQQQTGLAHFSCQWLPVLISQPFARIFKGAKHPSLQTSPVAQSFLSSRARTQTTSNPWIASQGFQSFSATVVKGFQESITIHVEMPASFRLSLKFSLRTLFSPSCMNLCASCT